jgi:hypothetical protein
MYAQVSQDDLSLAKHVRRFQRSHNRHMSIAMGEMRDRLGMSQLDAFPAASSPPMAYMVCGTS